MKIKKLKIKNKMRYIWLKSVEDVDLTNHCAKSLVGQYSKQFNSSTYEYNNIQLTFSKSGIYYLCGVSMPFLYSSNIHLAFKEKNGSNISINNDHITCEIEDAEILPIDPKYIDINSKYSNKKSYNTCRNWIFANYAKSTFF